jgi:hypothetical protein
VEGAGAAAAEVRRGSGGGLSVAAGAGTVGPRRARRGRRCMGWVRGCGTGPSGGSCLARRGGPRMSGGSSKRPRARLRAGKRRSAGATGGSARRQMSPIWVVSAEAPAALPRNLRAAAEAWRPRFPAVAGRRPGVRWCPPERSSTTSRGKATRSSLCATIPHNDERVAWPGRLGAPLADRCPQYGSFPAEAPPPCATVLLTQPRPQWHTLRAAAEAPAGRTRTSPPRARSPRPPGRRPAA